MVDDDWGVCFWEAKANYNEACPCIARGNAWLDDDKGLMFEELYPLDPTAAQARFILHPAALLRAETPDASKPCYT